MELAFSSWRRADTAGDKPHDLDWSLRPVFNSLRIFGIDFNVWHDEPSIYRRGRFIVLGTVVFACMQSSNLSRPSFETDGPVDLKSTKFWPDFLMKNAWLIWHIIFPLAMMEMVVLLRWKPLRTQFRKLQEFTSVQSNFHGHLRKFSVRFIASILSMVTSQPIYSHN